MAQPIIDQQIAAARLKIDAAITKYNVLPYEVVFLNRQGKIIATGGTDSTWTAFRDMVGPRASLIPSHTATIIANGDFNADIVGAAKTHPITVLVNGDANIGSLYSGFGSMMVKGNLRAEGTARGSISSDVTVGGTINAQEIHSFGKKQPTTIVSGKGVTTEFFFGDGTHISAGGPVQTTWLKDAPHIDAPILSVDSWETVPPTLDFSGKAVEWRFSPNETLDPKINPRIAEIVAECTAFKGTIQASDHLETCKLPPRAHTTPVGPHK